MNPITEQLTIEQILEKFPYEISEGYEDEECFEIM